MQQLLWTAVAVIGLFSVLVVFDDAVLVRRLREWQSSLSIIAGFAMLALTTTLAEQSKKDAQAQTARQLMLALGAETRAFQYQFDSLRKRARDQHSNANFVSNPVPKGGEWKGAPTVSIKCPDAGERMRVVEPIGVFESNRGNLGTLPEVVAVSYVEIHRDWRELNRVVRELNDKLPEAGEGKACDVKILRQVKIIEALTNVLLCEIAVAEGYSAAKGETLASAKETETAHSLCRRPDIEAPPQK